MALRRNFHKSCGKDGGKVGENPAALRAAVFSLASKNLRGGGRSNAPPPSRARVKNQRMTAFPANPYFRPKSAENDVTLTSFTTDL